MQKFTLAAIAMVSLLPASPTLAGGHCSDCFRREVSPPVYRTVYETVQVSPATTVARHVPAQYAIAHQTVQIAPATQGWTQKIDAHGRTILCRTTTPARYGVVAQTVMVRPATVVHEVIPARYATVARTVQVAPATERWVRVAPPHAHDAAHVPRRAVVARH